MLLLILFSIVFCFFFYHFYWKRRNWPPGPIPLPLIGNILPFIFCDRESLALNWKKQYGDIITVWFGPSPAIILHDIPTIMETFLKDGETFAGRNYHCWDNVIRDGRNGIILNEGEKWRETRRFSLHVFRNFGLGKNLMQERVLAEVSSLISDLKDEVQVLSDKDICVQDAIDMAVGSIINNLTFGYRYTKEKSAEFKKVKKFAQLIVGAAANPLYILMDINMEYFKTKPFCRTFYKEFCEKMQTVKTYFYDLIDEHRNSINFEVDSEPTDFVEAFLREQYRLEKDGIENLNFDDKQLYATVLDLWIAGQETTSNTLAWMCIYLIQNPDSQEKVHQELDKYIGSDRIITLDDKKSLNYVNAVVAETQRYCNLVSQNIPHKTTKDTVIHGYQIPAGTFVTPQISAVLMNEEYFPEPQKFKPERFLDENGKFFQPPELIPFGIGKRACMGEGLARLELYLFTANIINHFKLGFPSNMKDFGKKIIGGTTVPAPFSCKIENRF